MLAKLDKKTHSKYIAAMEEIRDAMEVLDRLKEETEYCLPSLPNFLQGELEDSVYELTMAIEEERENLVDSGEDEQKDEEDDEDE